MCLLVPNPGCAAPAPVVAPSVRPDAGGPASWANLTPSPFPSTFPDQRYAPLMTYDSNIHAVL
ncbi:MAG TPA: hypothetical protein VIZ68_08050, partial [Thermoplasmata archaeon]